MPTSASLVTNLPADFNTFGQGVDTSLQDLLGGTTGQVLKKNSNTNMDFVWSADNGMTNPMTTTGDTIYSSSGSTPARLGIGSTGQILTVASGLPSWATPAAGGGYTLITEVALSAITSYSFSSIPSTYKHLVLTWYGLEQSAISSTFTCRINNDSTANYRDQVQYQETGSTPTINATDNTSIGGETFGTHITSAQARQKGQGSFIIYNYASTTKAKYYNGIWSYYTNNNARVNMYNAQGFWYDTTAVTSLDIVRTSGSATMSNYANTSVRLYGVS